MVAELAQRVEGLPLLFEPDKPEPHGRTVQGWIRTRRIHGRIEHVGLHRRHEDDAFGARVQHAIARYVLADGRRSYLAAELGMSDTTFQCCLRGRAWGPYGRPVLRALRRLGITIGRGDWQVGARRAREIIAAQRSLLDRCEAALLAPNLPPSDRDLILADMRLLAAASEREP